MKKFFTLITAAAMALASQAATLDVCMGESLAGTLPIYGLWADTENTLGQMIYPADMLADMAGSDITGVQFYTSINGYEALGIEPQNGEYDYIRFSGATIQLSLMVVDQLGFTEEVAVVGATPVATTVPEYGDRYMTFVLDEPFHYEGGNLLVEAKVIEPGEYGSCYYWVQAVEDYNPGYYEYEGYSGTVGYAVSYLPAATFTYEVGQTPVDPEDPHMTGKWIVIIDKRGEEHWYNLNADPDGDPNWMVMLTLHHNPWGENAEFYFMVDGVRYGAETDMQLPAMGDAEQTILNPVFQGDNLFYVVAGYTYTFGLQFKDGQIYLLVAQGTMTGVDEFNSDKAVAGVRYFNMAGQEMQQASGMTIVVTTYTDGTTSAVKVIK